MSAAAATESTMVARREDPKKLETQVRQAMADAEEAIRWCKKHLHQRKTPEAIRLVQANLGYLAMALEWRMDGQVEDAASAIERIWWRPTHDPAPVDIVGH